jgi:xylulokinase
MLAMVAAGVYPTVAQACEQIVRVVDTVKPDPELVQRYEAQYQKFRRIYPAMRELFPEIL